jgi:lambda family phage tail tape measure protein
MAKAYADGVSEVKTMNLAIALGGDISGQTASSLRALAGDMATHSQLTIAESKSIASVLASSGQIGAGAFNKVAEAAGNFARVTGADVARVGPELVKLFANPAKGAEELNRQMHFLSAAELDHIAQLQRQGDLTGAQIELVDKYNKRMSEIAPQLGLIEGAWKRVEGGASKGWAAMMGIGIKETTQQKLDAARKAVADVEAMGPGEKNLPKERQLLALRQNMLKLEDQLDNEQQQSFANSAYAKKLQNEEEERTIARRYSIAVKAAEIDDQILRMQKSGVKGAADAVAALEKEKADLYKTKKGPAAGRDLYADAMNDAAGVNRDFTKTLIALKAGFDAGNTSEASYVATVETLINKQPFATKSLQETIKALADKEHVLRKVETAEHGASEVVERAKEANAQRVEALRTEIEMMGKNAAERARITEFRKIDLQLEKDVERVRERLGGIGDTEGMNKAHGELQRDAEQAKAAWVDAHTVIEQRGRDWIAGAKDGLQSYADEAEKVAGRVADAFKQGAKMAEDAIANFVVSGKLDLGSLLRYAATEMARENIAKPIVSAGTDWLRGLLSSGSGDTSVSKSNANGDVFASAGLHRYANTVVSSPTLFRFAAGGAIGEMGEAGPEAIMPLRRGPDGKLGVQASGGGSLVVNIIEDSSRAGQVQQRQSGGQNALDVFVDRVRSALAGDIVSGNGPVPMALDTTYGLNRAAGGH